MTSAVIQRYIEKEIILTTLQLGELPPLIYGRGNTDRLLSTCCTKTDTIKKRLKNRRGSVWLLGS